MTTTAALIYCGLTAFIVAFHLCLIGGAPWGHLTMGGRWPGRLSIRQRMVSVVSILFLSLMAVIVAGQGGLFASQFPAWAIWPVMVYLVLGILVHIATPSRAERRLWLPVIVAMAVAALAVVFA